MNLKAFKGDVSQKKEDSGRLYNNRDVSLIKIRYITCIYIQCKQIIVIELKIYINNH